jgi:hypothetical protein
VFDGLNKEMEELEEVSEVEEASAPKATNPSSVKLKQEKENMQKAKTSGKASDPKATKGAVKPVSTVEDKEEDEDEKPVEATKVGEDDEEEEEEDELNEEAAFVNPLDVGQVEVPLDNFEWTTVEDEEAQSSGLSILYKFAKKIITGKDDAPRKAVNVALIDESLSSVKKLYPKEEFSTNNRILRDELNGLYYLTVLSFALLHPQQWSIQNYQEVLQLDQHPMG